MLELPVTLYGFKGKQVRDVLFIGDVCRLIDIQMKKIDNLKGEVFNIGGGDYCNTSLLECITLIEELVGKKLSWSYDKHQRKSDQCVYISDIKKAEKKLGWTPQIFMKDGIINIIDWVEKNKKELERLYAR